MIIKFYILGLIFGAVTSNIDRITTWTLNLFKSKKNAKNKDNKDNRVLPLL